MLDVGGQHPALEHHPAQAGHGVEVAREFGVAAVPVPAAIAHAAARASSAIPRLPFTPAAADWVEAMSHPAIMDTSKAKQELGWSPRYTSAEALRATIETGL